MKAHALARLHARAMRVPGPWTETDFDELLATKASFFVHSSVDKYPGEREELRPSHVAATKQAQDLAGFALGRIVLDEAELLTLAVDPDHQREGIGRRCLGLFESEAALRGAAKAYLEVAETNQAAIALYHASGWVQNGRRKAYYKSTDARIDAILMSKTLVAC
ncbi:MAG: GNAT family N-acetyltransferase [Pseudomonadota bacterium]